ncbi:MAG: nuclear transport factor 2 family protein [Candidatus Bathyarchaeia archaeon]
MTVLSRHVSGQTSVGAVEGFFDALRRHNIDDMMRYCNPKGRIRMVPLGREGEGEIQTVGRKLWGNMIDAFPNLTNSVDFIFSDLDGHVCAEVMISGTQSKDFWGIKNVGLSSEISHAFLFEVGEDGRIQKISDYWDRATEYRKLGSREL